MPEKPPQTRKLRFGEYELIPSEMALIRGRERVPMTPRVFHLLLILVENAGRLVTKETLLNEIWQDSIVEEGNLNSTVSRLRKILGEKADEKRFIETVPRVGYRFVADVVTAADGMGIETEPTESSAQERRPDVVGASRRRMIYYAVPGILLVAAALTVVVVYLARKPDTATAGPMQKNVLSPMTDTLTGDLAARWARRGKIRYLHFQDKRPISFVMNWDGSDPHRETTIAGLSSGTWSPDDKRVVFTKEADDSGALYLANSDGSGEIKLPFPAGNLDWSPDSAKIVYQIGRPNPDLYLYDLETGKTRPLVTDPSFDGDPSYSPDGKSVAFISGRDGNLEIYVQNIDGSGLRRLTDHPARDAFPSFSPDGTEIVFNSNREDENMDVYIMDVNGGDVRRLTNWSSDEEQYPGSWSPDGTQLLVNSNHSGRDSIYVMNIEPYIATEVFTDRAFELHSPTYSPDGSTILFEADAEGGAGELQTMDIETKRISTIALLHAQSGYPKFSPDGRSVLFQDKIGNNTEICLINADGSGEVQNLTNNPARDRDASWSPDGSKIVFSSNRDGNFDISQLYIMNADGTNQHRIYQSDAISVDPSWSPDGREIVFANDKEDGRNGNFEIFSIEPETPKAEKRLTFRPRYDISPVFSPDGKRIAFVSNADGNFEVYVMNSDGSSLLRLTRDAASDGEASWSPDGRKIVFTSNRNGRMSILEIVVGL